MVNLMNREEVFSLLKQNGFEYDLDPKNYLLEIINDRWQLIFFWCDNQVSFITYKRAHNSNIYTKKMLDLIYKISEIITEHKKDFWRD